MKHVLSTLFVFFSAYAYAQKLPITVISYNIRYSNNHDGENGWDLRRQNVQALFRFYEADIFCVQEALAEQFDYLKATPGYAAIGVGREDGIRKGEFAAIYYNNTRFKALTSGTFWLSETPDKVSKGWDAALERICTWAKLYDNATKQAFVVFNTHFDHKGVQARTKSALLIKQKIQQLAGTLPVVLTGDLNVTPDAPAIGTLSTFLHDTKTISKAKPYGPEGTFEDFDWNAPLKDKIDYIFVAGGFKVLKFGVLSDSKNRKYPSDHLPVLAKLSF